MKRIPKQRSFCTLRNGDVVTYLAAPQHPKAAIVYVPGAGEKPAGHEERMVRYSAAGYAFLFVDIRGNGGQTPGYPLNPQRDFSLFEKGYWPQYYETICDLVASRQMLSNRFGVPVYAMGSSNGGRYAAVATGVDPELCRVCRDLNIRLGYTGFGNSGWRDGRRDTVWLFPGTQHILQKNISAPGLDLPCSQRHGYPV